MAELPTLAEALRFLTQAILLITTLLVGAEYLRRRQRELADAALMFASLGVSTLVAWIAWLGYEPRWLATLSTLALVAHPYLIVRVVKQFRKVPTAVEVLLALGMIGGWALVAATAASEGPLFRPGGAPALAPTALLVLLAYFAFGELYAAYAFVDGARRASGLSRRRLRFAAIGTGILGLLFGAALLPAVVPVAGDTISLMTQPLGLLAILSFYLAFAPPRWLRRTWQLEEVARFLSATSGRSAGSRAEQTKHELQAATLRLTGARRVTFVEPIDGGWSLDVLHADGTRQAAEIERPAHGALARAFRSQSVVLHRGEAPETALERAEGIAVDGEKNLLVVPLASQGAVRALVSVPLTRIPLFLDESAQALRLLAEQAVVVLDAEASLAAQEALRLKAARATADELRRQNYAMQEATRLKSEFLANMSHELRTPLNGIIGFAELLASGKAGKLEPTHQEFMGDILTSARHLLQLINDVLDLAKVEAGRMEFRPERVDPRALVEETLVVVRPLADLRSIHIDVSASPEVGEVVVDPLRFKQVVYNFVSNAVKFTPEGGKVTIRLEPEDPSRFRVGVDDTGVGIKASDIPKLFHEFQQLDGSMTKQHQGTGLGLALVKRLVEAQGGSVSVKSVPAKGSTFSAVLPREAATPAVPTEAEEIAAGRARVLVVEDDTRDRAAIVSVLRAQGYEVDEAANVHDALALLAQREYAATTLDLLLPDGHGYDVLKAIRERAGGESVAVLIVTKLPPDRIHVVHRIEGIFQKPIEPAVLAETLRRAGVGPTAGRPVLVVDDDATVRRLVQAHLRSLGYRAVPAANGRAALEAAEREPPALIVLDLVMPEMDGFAFLDEYRAKGGLAPIIVWTSKDLSGEEDARLRGQVQLVVYKADGGSFTLANRLEEALTRR